MSTTTSNHTHLLDILMYKIRRKHLNKDIDGFKIQVLLNLENDINIFYTNHNIILLSI